MVRTLSELQGRDPLILLLARGNYCPKHRRFDEALVPAVVDAAAPVPVIAAGGIGDARGVAR